jgi:hypothetical protein
MIFVVAHLSICLFSYAADLGQIFDRGKFPFEADMRQFPGRSRHRRLSTEELFMMLHNDAGD